MCTPASLRWEVRDAATAGVKRCRLTPERARQLLGHLGFPLLALDGPIRRNAKKLGLSFVKLDL
jgi:hypothetical protein